LERGRIGSHHLFLRIHSGKRQRIRHLPLLPSGWSGSRETVTRKGLLYLRGGRPFAPAAPVSPKGIGFNFWEFFMYRLLAIAIAFSFVLTAADNPSRSAAGTVLAEIDGVKITLADFEAKRPAGLFQARNSFFEAEHKAIDEFVSDYLLIREAQ